MSGRHDQICTLEELHTFIHQTLCGKEGLLTDQFPLTAMQLTRRGRPCGLQFSLQGPRDVRLGAVWASDHNIIYFYDTRGERYLKVSLTRRLHLTAVVTDAAVVTEAAVMAGVVIEAPKLPATLPIPLVEELREAA